ncbi:MAG TPA: DEAD/DEAH box helicase [Saprospiraceae bacterium]|jgi:ATP-dependent RNA helicase RhlE|nr:DEAD/DEAH box helicase [Saprospiraceae bacterium]HRO07355.1 DEAD/DEAH box helicase [Saprospiraceae bacterium]HRP40638.1 DEAD/DEAH box helicase [Saprospiraceae bacterium]
MHFSEYHFIDELKNNLEKSGFRKPTDIQYKCIPNILRGEDLLAIAQTGTGKTAAFAIPVIHILHSKINPKRRNGIRCVVMVPTRELALQINDVFTKFSKNTRVTSMSVFGGVEQDPQIAKLAKGVDILITTPGRLFDLVSQGYILLQQTEILILDEADHMLDKGFIKDIRDLIRFLPKKRQTLFFSATIDEEIKDLAYSLVKNPIRIQISPKDPVSKNVNHSVVFVSMDDKRFFLERLVQENPDSKILVFVRTKVRCERVQAAMLRVGIESVYMHGGKEQKDRIDTLNQFRSGKVKMLIATDVSARGIDIPDVAYVVNYDLPEHPENYVHRVGRTGRGKNKGFAYSFCDESEKKLLTAIEDYIGKNVQVLELGNEGYKEIRDFTSETEMDISKIIEQLEPEPNKRYGVKKSKKKK